MSTKFAELTIWITGASSGLGEALAVEFAKRGSTVILSGRNKQKLEAVKAKCQHADKHIILPFDIVNAKQTIAAYQTLKTELEAKSQRISSANSFKSSGKNPGKKSAKKSAKKSGNIDWLINNAGVSQRSLIMETVDEVERQLMEINYFAQTRLTRLVLPEMIKQCGGKIVMVSSVAGLLGTQYRGAYGAAKAAIHMWANSLRAELTTQNIKVATVFPGFIQTNVSINALTGDGSTQGTMDEATGKGLTAAVFAKRVVNALQKDETYIIAAGQKEKIATLLNRLSPPKLYQIIRQVKVK